ncbi:MAG: PilT/PilU family type 4a pilus ATPase [Victivallales bacterium]|nr:PilT/PilU family type 4a pilus ATPase [Victivallales bacterium]
MKNESITNEIDWFFYHLVQENIIDKEMCVSIIETLEEAGLVPSISFIIQVMIENGLYKDKFKLESMKRDSVQEAQTLGRCRTSVFGVSEAAAPVVSDTAEQQPSAAVTPDAKVETISAGDAKWLEGWPNLNDAANMQRESALKLLNDFLHRAREAGCSDVHISAGAYPFVRKHKEMFLLPGQEIVSNDAARELNLAPLTDEQRDRFIEHHDLDYSYNITDNDRYRTNLMAQRLGPSGSYRIINSRIIPIAELGFKDPKVLEKLTTYNQGLILITGPAGSGKTTTLSSLVDFINQNRKDHIITVEDPIEIIYVPKGCNITQRELNNHTRSFTNALRAALREDPDVIVVGEMRDLETIEMAIHASETGHLVFGTLHTSSASDTMNRLLDVFPHGQQAQIRAMVAESLKGVICQQLLTNKDHTGVVLAYEIMLGTLAVSNLIREGKTFQIESSIQTSKNLGMITMEQCHFDLYMAGKRSYDQTLPYIKNPDLKRQMGQHEMGGMGVGANAAANRMSTGPAKAEQPPEPPPKKRGWFGRG